MARSERTGTGRLDELYVRHHSAAIGLAYLLTGSLDQAEDLVQEAFVRLAGRFQHLRYAEAFGAYLRRTIVNLHASRLRHRRVERAHAEREHAAATESPELPDVAVRTDLWRTLRQLPPRQRAAVVLRYYEDLAERDAAETLGCSVAALKSLVARAMDTLRATLEEDGDD